MNKEVAPKVLDAPQAAAFLGLSPQTLANSRHKRTGPPYHKLGSRVVYSVADLEAYLSARRINPEAQEAR